MSRRKLTERFIETLHDDFVVHGAEIIERLRIESPSVYAQVCAKLVPVQAQIEVSEVDLLEEKMTAMTQRERIAFQRGLLDEMEAELDAQERLDQMPLHQRAKLIYEAEKLEPKPGSP
jgi:hypothetical protein